MIKAKTLRGYLKHALTSSHAEGYGEIVSYFLPEFVTSLVLYSMPYLVDALMIAQLESTSTYATLGITNTWLHFLIKVAEGLSIGTIILSGRANGQKDFEKAGTVLVHSFWMTVIIGLIVGVLIYLFGHLCFIWYNVAPEVYMQGIPFLKIRAIGVFFSFVYFAFMGFFRGIKDTSTPMKIFILGCSLFLLCDYILIFGKWGLPALGLQGSAIATVIQYFSMSCIAFFYILYSKDCSAYRIRFFSQMIQWSKIKELFLLSWPGMVDRGTLAAAYIWLGKCIASLGDTSILASFTAIKDVERFVFLPAIALSQIIAFLVSNAWARNDKDYIKATIARVVLLAALMVFVVVVLCCLDVKFIFSFFDKKGDFSVFSAQVFPVVSILIFFDLLQLILASALRGSGDVKTVMWTRLTVCIGFFGPVSYFFSVTVIQNSMLKFILIYTSLYLAAAIMGVIYIKRFSGSQWKQEAIRDTHEYKQRRSLKNS